MTWRDDRTSGVRSLLRFLPNSLISDIIGEDRRFVIYQIDIDWTMLTRRSGDARTVAFHSVGAQMEDTGQTLPDRTSALPRYIHVRLADKVGLCWCLSVFMRVVCVLRVDCIYIYICLCVSVCVYVCVCVCLRF